MGKKIMINNLFTQAHEVYLCSNELTLRYINVEYPALFNYSKYLRNFFCSIGESRSEDYWLERKRRLRRLGFLFLGAPLSKSFLQKQLTSAIDFVEQDIDSCGRSYPSHLSKYKTLLTGMKELLVTELDNLKQEVDNLIQTLDGSIAILINDTRLIPEIDKLYPNRNIHIVSKNSLRNFRVFDNLIIIGPLKWFPPFVFSSPRAKKIFIVKFQWVRDDSPQIKVFPNSTISTPSNNSIDSDHSSNNNDDYIEPSLFLPTIDFSFVIKSAWDHVEEDGGKEFVEAIIGCLENDQIVFLEYDDTSTVRIIDIEDEDKPVKKIRVKELTPEMFLLLKTSGGGDYIIPVADSILREQADRLRNTQRSWKNLLRDKIKLLSEDGVINELHAKGCSIANPINLRNWISYRSIKTSKLSDFKAIMSVIGLDGQIDDIWHQMRLITRAHIQAGRYITELLIKMIKEVNLSELMRMGIMEFELPDKDAGCLTAFRVKALSDRQNSVLVSPTKIGIPLDIE